MNRRITNNPVASNCVATKAYVVASFNKQTGHSISHSPKEHFARTDAIKEAERLATLYPGVTYVVLEVIGSVVASGHTWS